MALSAWDLLRSTHISYSKLHVYGQCPRRFKLEYLDDRRPEKSVALQLGSMVHAVIAHYLRDIQETQRRLQTDPEDLKRLIRKTRDELREKGEVTAPVSETDVGTLLRGFTRLLPHIDGRAIAAVEAEKLTRIGPWMLKSILDLVLRNSHGETHIIDFKTGKRRYVKGFQLRTYALPILGNRVANINHVRLTYAFLRERTLWSFHASRFECQGIVDSIIAQCRQIEADTTFKPRPTRLCDWCGVRGFCSAYRQKRPT